MHVYNTYVHGERLHVNIVNEIGVVGIVQAVFTKIISRYLVDNTQS